uniref:Uncharacterized protein n=1 Tax=Acrobeloides nanus TaxID=290746 RepID=A0A914DXM6_9BILA
MQESLQSRRTVPIKNSAQGNFIHPPKASLYSLIDKVDLSQLPFDYEPIDCYKCCSKMKFNIREMQAKSGKVLKIPILRCSNLNCNAYKAVKKIISNGTLKKKQKIGTNENLQPSILIQKSVKFSEMIQSEDGPKEDVDEGYFDQSSYLSPIDNSKSEKLFSEKNGIAVVLVEDIDVEKIIQV